MRGVKLEVFCLKRNQRITVDYFATRPITSTGIFYCHTMPESYLTEKRETHLS